MRWIYKLPLRFRSVLRKSRVEQELSEEIRFHLENLIDEKVAKGLSPEEARHAAMRELGGIEQIKEQCRDARAVNFLETLLQDVRYGLRMLAKNPGFTGVAVLTLALGIGANTAVFSVVNAVLLKPLPYPDPDRIVRLSSAQKGSTEHGPVSAPDFHDWHDHSIAFAALAYYKAEDTAATVGSLADYVHAARVTPEFFRVFEVNPVVGRLFTADEEKPGSAAAVVISYSYWQSHFGGSPTALGQTLRLYSKPLRVVGVLPPRFRFPDNTEIWFPANTILPENGSRAGLNYWAIGRLRPSVTLEQAQAEMNSLAARLEHQYHTFEGMTVAVARMRDDMVSHVRLTLYLLLGAVALVLLIACTNVATLLLARATARTRELAVRAALGAGRTRILRQLITESSVLALVAGTVGLGLAIGGSRALVACAPATVPRLADTGVDGWVLAFTFGVSVMASLLFGLAPALQVVRLDLDESLKRSEGRAIAGGSAGRIRSALVVIEIALSVVLLVAAGLLIKSFITLHNVELGFHPEHVLVMNASVPASDLKGERRATQFYVELLPDISTLPGVLAAGATTAIPGHVSATVSYWNDYMPRVSTSAPTAVASLVAPGTFAALGIPLEGGRDFNGSDTYDEPFTAIVNKALARAAFPGQDPLGRTIFCGLDSPNPMRIVGVVGDVRQYGPAREPSPEIYMPYEQHPSNATDLDVLVRTVSAPEAIAETLRRKVRDRASDVPVKFTTLEASLSDDVAPPRFRTLLLGIFAGVAVCLAIAGIYGVMTYVIGQRSNEIGLRMALGATPGNLLRLLLQQALVLVSAGIGLGLAVGLGVSRLLTSLLFKVRPTDPLTYAEVVTLLALVALAASYIPARRATKVDPMVALRWE